VSDAATQSAARDLAVRRGGPSDRVAVCALQLASWRDAYRGFLPDAYLDGDLADELDAKWRAKMAGFAPERALLLVAEANERPQGFLFACPDPQTPQSAYVDNLHVRPGVRGGGIGAALMRRAARDLAVLGYRGMHLLVFAGNARAVRFYERHGGAIVARTTEDLMGYPADTYRIVWSDLARVPAA
jgi:ribosomal protein S18 acetylase RimI-like enzyme